MTTSIEQNRHPQYSAVTQDYVRMRDTAAGQRTIKEKTVAYLPPAPSWLDSAGNFTVKGRKAYSSYIARAYFPNLVSEAVAGLVGIMNSEPAQIFVPPKMEYLIERATSEGDSLQTLLTLIYSEQLLMGRIGLLTDLDKASNLPFLVPHLAENIVNWNNASGGLLEPRKTSLIVTDESEDVLQVVGTVKPNNTTFKKVEKFRAFFLGTEQGEIDVSKAGRYRTIESVDGIDSEVVTPVLQGTGLERVPFVFIGANDLNPAPDKIPLMDLANIALAIYCGEADHRLTLFGQGQSTLFTFGSTTDEEDPAIGVGVHWQMGKDESAEFVGVSADGLSEMRESLQNDYERASEKGSDLLTSSGGGGVQSGDALRIRVAARTATLNTIARIGSAGLRDGLQNAARFMGLSDADIDSIKVTPNTDFVRDLAPIGEIVMKLQQSINMGAQIAQRSAHEVYVKLGITERSFEDERKLIDSEDREVDIPGLSGGAETDNQQQRRTGEEEDDTPTPNRSSEEDAE